MAKRSGHSDDSTQRLQQLIEDCLRRVVAGETVPVDEITAANPDLMPELAHELREVERIGRAKRAGNLTETAPVRERTEPTGSEPAAVAPEAIPGEEIVRELSHRGQGVVHQAIQKLTKPHGDNDEHRRLQHQAV